MPKRTYQQLGIPEGYGFKKLLYVPSSKLIVVQVKSWPHDWRNPDRLFLRGIDETAYRPIGTPAEMASQESPTLHPVRPLLAYISDVHSFSRDIHGVEHAGGDWSFLEVTDLIGSTSTTVTQSTLKIPAPYLDGWITGILSFGDSESLFVIAAVKVRVSEDFNRIDYFIAELDLKTHALSLVTHLPATFM